MKTFFSIVMTLSLISVFSQNKGSTPNERRVKQIDYRSRIDSLNKNLQKLQYEPELLNPILEEVSRTLSQIEGKKQIDTYNIKVVDDKEWYDKYATLLSIGASLLGAFISVFFAVRIFNDGIERDRNEKERMVILEQQEKDEERKNEFERTRRLLQYLLPEIKTKVQDQLKEYKEYINGIDENHFQSKSFKNLINPNISRLNEIETIVLTDLFHFLKLDDKNLISLLNSIEYLYQVLPLIKNDLDAINKSNVYLINEFIKLREGTLNDMAEYLRVEQESNGDENNQLYDLYDNSIRLYYEKADQYIDIKYDLENLVKPLRGKLFQGGFVRFERTQTVVKNLRTLSNYTVSIKYSNINYVLDLKKSIAEIERAIEEIDKVIDLIKKT